MQLIVANADAIWPQPQPVAERPTGEGQAKAPPEVAERPTGWAFRTDSEVANIVMAYIVMAYIVMGCIVMAYIVMACTGMAYIVMAYTAKAYIVMV